ncbi:unnamed protein product [Rotaria sordida]|uniref:Uncharacterized protein n=1 Tax=Rotaria sordida TaxID=392033 RepID=A0A819YI75_9BILA|nr:unnamed protein product [Rotaria sordida]CAF4150096.1 unnamed protein product [Rotaria sordida]
MAAYFDHSFRIVESGEITQSFSSNWMPNKNQRMTVINTDEIARKLEAAYGIESGSIRISTIMINNGETNVDGHRRRRQLDRKKRDMYVFTLRDFS